LTILMQELSEYWSPWNQANWLHLTKVKWLRIFWEYVHHLVSCLSCWVTSWGCAVDGV
jgi:hypothetical protein